MASTHKLSVVVGNFIALTCNFNVGIDNFRVAIGSFTTPPGKLWYSGANFMTSTYKLSCRGRQLRSTTCDFNVEVGSFTTPTYNFTSTARNFVVARACQGLLRHRTHEFHIDSDGGVIRPRRCRQSLSICRRAGYYRDLPKQRGLGQNNGERGRRKTQTNDPTCKKLSPAQIMLICYLKSHINS
jgi:hypothetical protein